MRYCGIADAFEHKLREINVQLSVDHGAVAGPGVA